MAADPHHIDPTAYLEELLTQASPDLMRQMLTDFINQILSAQADTVCGADYATVSAERTNTRNGYRHRHLLPERSLHSQDERPGGHPWDQQLVEVSGEPDGQRTR